MKPYLLFSLLLLLAAPFVAPQQSMAAEQSPAAVTPTDNTPAAFPTSPLAPIATQLGQTLQTLVGTTSSQPTQPGTNDSEDSATQITDTFATALLSTLAHAVNILKADSATLAGNIAALPDFVEWIARQNSDPRRQALWTAIGSDLLIVIGVPILVGIALSLLLMPARLTLRRGQPKTLSGKVGFLLALFALRLIPILLFVGSALLLLDQNETHRLPRFIILNVIYALTLGYAIHEILRSVFATKAPHLRLIPMSTPRAIAAYRWLDAFNFVIVYGYFLIDEAGALRVPDNVVTVFQNGLALILTIMAVTVIIRVRGDVASLLRGEDADDEHPHFGQNFREFMARHWHRLASSYLIIGLLVTLLGIDNGLALMLRGTLLTVAILATTRLAFLGLTEWTKPKQVTGLVHRQLLSFLLQPVLWILTAVMIATVWGFGLREWLTTALGQRVAAAVISIGLTILILTALYETINAAIERHLNRRDKITKLPVASARARTLLPMVRNSIFILFTVAVVLTCLSAVGVNIAPLLAGAGVLGVAVGFGSQTLVKDFLTGLFIVVENTIAVGDVVKIGDYSGVVEALSIRTIRLRDSDGSLHTVPFGEVTKITNYTKSFSYALVDVRVSYDSDLQRVMAVLREIGAQIQEDPVFKRVIIEPIEVMGVQKLGDSGVTIRARMRTRPGKQWDINSLLLLRIKERFEKEKIEIPYPTTKSITVCDAPGSSV